MNDDRGARGCGFCCEAVWIYQHFRARRGERKTKKLAFSGHGSYQIVGRLGENAYRIAIPTYPDRVATPNVNRMKKFKGRMSRPFPTEVPSGVETRTGVNDDGPLTEEDLPSISYVERITVDNKETVFSGLNGNEKYLVLTASYEVCWLRTASLLPTYKVLIDSFEDEGDGRMTGPSCGAVLGWLKPTLLPTKMNCFLAVLEVDCLTYYVIRR
ncbi:LOW QUALITY PROTEIN: hypothetical protein PHMEG_00021973 [Phytophthora megakarya]|uniref:Uncharacterized protein n=1 Tax=Phytophthora megakarya TaxID=4795 RepID=A0A225VLV5_9STRA|nr:LOW QUALITY PROTEIN: hypothetical protein PHMEG_00021973 [Phytophthora megakarya]